jgi:hypothetical protein
MVVPSRRYVRRVSRRGRHLPHDEVKDREADEWKTAEAFGGTYQPKIEDELAALSEHFLSREFSLGIDKSCSHSARSHRHRHAGFGERGRTGEGRLLANDSSVLPPQPEQVAAKRRQRCDGVCQQRAIAEPLSDLERKRRTAKERRLAEQAAQLVSVNSDGRR